MCARLSKPFSETALEFEFCCCHFFTRANSPEPASDWTGAGRGKAAVEETHRPFPGMLQNGAAHVFSPLYPWPRRPLFLPAMQDQGERWHRWALPPASLWLGFRVLDAISAL